MLSKKQLEDAVRCKESHSCSNCSMDNGCIYDSACIDRLSQTALAYRAMLERYEKEWRTGYEINFGEGEIPKTETEYWEIVALLKESEG